MDRLKLSVLTLPHLLLGQNLGRDIFIVLIKERDKVELYEMPIINNARCNGELCRSLFILSL